MTSDSKSAWQRFPLGDMLTFQRGFDITKTQQQPGPYQVISSSGPQWSHHEFKVKGPGLVIGRKGTLGTVFYSEDDFWPHDTTLWVKDFHGNDPRFAYYFLQTMGLERYDAGASNPTLNRNHIHSIPVCYPDPSSQRRIASILSAYDDLIENNARRIAILEEMAQMLYREWFVHFHFPGHGQVRMVESPLGPIPEGWEVVALREVADLVRGIEPGSSNYLDSPADDYIPFLRVGDLGSRNSGIYITRSLAGDKILDREDIVITLDGTVGIVKMGLVGAYSSGIRKVIANGPMPLPRSFLYCLLKSSQVQDIIQAHARGTTILHASSAIDHIRLLLPPSHIVEAFDVYAGPLLQSQLNLEKKNANLRRTWGLLLPRLVSGEVDVDDSRDGTEGSAA